MNVPEFLKLFHFPIYFVYFVINNINNIYKMPEIVEGYKRYKYRKKTKKVSRTSSKLNESVNQMKAYESNRTIIQRNLDAATKGLNKTKDNKVKAKSLIEKLEKEKNSFVDERNLLLNELEAAKTSPNAKHLEKEIDGKIKELEHAHADKTRNLLSKLSRLQIDTLPNLASIIKGDVVDKFNVESISRLKEGIEKPSLAEKTHNENMEHNKLILEASDKKIEKYAKILELNKEQYSELGKFDDYMMKIKQKALENRLKESEKRTKKLLKNPKATIEIIKSKEEVIEEAFEHFNENPTATVEDFMNNITAESVGMVNNPKEFEEFKRALALRVTYVAESVKLSSTKEAADGIRSESKKRVEASGASDTLKETPNARRGIAATVENFVNVINEYAGEKPLIQEDIKKLVASSKSELAKILQSFGVRNNLLKSAKDAGKVAVDKLSIALQNTVELLSRDFKNFKQTPEYNKFMDNINKTELKSFNSLQEYMNTMISNVKNNPNFNIESATKIVSELIRNAALLHLPKVKSGIKSILNLFTELPPEPVNKSVP